MSQNLLKQITSLQERLEVLQDVASDALGPSHEVVQELMSCFALSFACHCDIEKMLEEYRD